MPIINTEIKLFKSTNGLGGAITANEIVSGELHNVFSKVTSDEALLGKTCYRCIYVKNANLSITLEAAKAYKVGNTPSNTTELEIGLGTALLNSSEQVIANELTAPVGIAFSSLTGVGNALSLGNLPAESYKAIWLKLIVAPNATAFNADGATIEIVGDTGA